MAEWHPFEDLASLRQEIDRAFEGFGAAQDPLRHVAFLPGREPRRYPLINLLEDKDNVYVEALTPGVDPQSMNVTAMHNRLTLSGEKAGVGDIKLEAFHRNERASGKFVRTIDLPVEIDEAKIQAEYKNGILVVTLPKAEKAKTKQIRVKVACAKKTSREQIMAEKTVPARAEDKVPLSSEETRSQERYITPPVDIYETAD